MTEQEEFIVWLEEYLSTLHPLQKNIHLIKIEERLQTVEAAPVAKKKYFWSTVLQLSLEYGPKLIKRIKWKK